MSVKRGRGVKMLINVDGRSTIFLFNPKNIISLICRPLLGIKTICLYINFEEFNCKFSF